MSIQDLYNRAKNTRVGRAAGNAMVGFGSSVSGMPGLSSAPSALQGIRGLFKPRTQTLPNGQQFSSPTPNISDQSASPALPSSAGQQSSKPTSYGNMNSSGLSNTQITDLTNFLQSVKGGNVQQPTQPNDMQMFSDELSGDPSIEQMYQMRGRLNNVRNDFVTGENKQYLGMEEGEVPQFSPSQINDIRNANARPYDVMGEELNARILRAQDEEDQANSLALARNKGEKKDDAGEVDGTAAVSRIDEILGNEGGLKGSVGTTGIFGRRGLGRRGVKQKFLADVSNLLSLLTVETFAQARARGVTFGAASEAEWNLLRTAATTIGGYADIDPETNKLIGLEGREEDIINELNLLRGKLGGGSTPSGGLSAQVASKGYDYQKMKADGHSDEEIKRKLGI